MLWYVDLRRLYLPDSIINVDTTNYNVRKVNVNIFLVINW